MPVPVIDIAQMRAWEAATWATGQTEAEVIRQAGAAVARCAESLTRPNDSILILAGKGHNGDDARLAGDALTERHAKVLNVTDPVACLSALKQTLASRPALAVDGLFGIGLNRSLSPEWLRLIETVNSSRIPVLAVDVPSGLDADTGEDFGAAVRCAATITMGALKKGLLAPSAWPYVGKLFVARDIGLAACTTRTEALWTLPDDFNGYPPLREVAGHKGTYGHLLAMAGSPGYHGAAVLAARGALRARPGLVTVWTMPGSYLPVASQLQAAMAHPWTREMEPPASTTALIAGPGLAAADIPVEIKTQVARFWRQSPHPMVVDASALEWLPPGVLETEAIRIITPHPGEAARLLGIKTAEAQSDRVKAMRALSARFGGCWVVLKGHQSLIGRATGGYFINSSGNPYLAQGGSGDLLTGYLGGLLAQPALQSDPETAIRFAVWRHGQAADELQARGLTWTIADLAEAI